MHGQVPKVVFSCANPVVDEKVQIYYGGADHIAGLAMAGLNDLIEYVRYGKA